MLKGVIAKDWTLMVNLKKETIEKSLLEGFETVIYIFQGKTLDKWNIEVFHEYIF